MFIDEIGDDYVPDEVYFCNDDVSGMTGVLVIDNMNMPVAAGGIRMLPDVTTEEIFLLARAMSYKFAMLDLPVSGAKGGIKADPASENRKEIIKTYGNGISPFLETFKYRGGADMGTTGNDYLMIMDELGLDHRRGITSEIRDELTVNSHLVGLGVITALEQVEPDLEDVTIGMEGFGKAGMGAAYYLNEKGARITHVVTIEGGVKDEKGIDFQELKELQEKHGDLCVEKYDGEEIGSESIYFADVDVLIPGARPHVITEESAYGVQADIICPIANVPTTSQGERILINRGIVSVPDFIANIGEVIGDIVDLSGGGVEDAFTFVKNFITEKTKNSLKGFDQGIPPRQFMIEKARKVIDKYSEEPLKTDDIFEKLPEIVEKYT